MALIRICLLLMLVATCAAAVQDGDAVAISRGLGATMVLYSDDGRAEFLGAGFVYGDATVGLTNAHVVRRWRPLWFNTAMDADQRHG